MLRTAGARHYPRSSKPLNCYTVGYTVALLLYVEPAYCCLDPPRLRSLDVRLHRCMCTAVLLQDEPAYCGLASLAMTLNTLEIGPLKM